MKTTKKVKQKSKCEPHDLGDTHSDHFPRMFKFCNNTDKNFQSHYLQLQSKATRSQEVFQQGQEQSLHHLVDEIDVLRGLLTYLQHINVSLQGDLSNFPLTFNIQIEPRMKYRKNQIETILRVSNKNASEGIVKRGIVKYLQIFP